MTYFVFDLDEAMAELHSVHYFLSSLRMKQTILEDNPYFAIYFPDELNDQLNHAYQLFVERVLDEELSDRPLGIIRPGLLGIMKKLLKMKDKGQITNVVIYSNNGNLFSLEFIRDLIHLYLGADLICDCSHYRHPLRNRFYEKSWNMIYRILVEGKCKASPLITPKDVYFFDDQIHQNLFNALGSHYYRVPAYDFRASFDRISLIYESVLADANVRLSNFIGSAIGIFSLKQTFIKYDLQEIIMSFKFLTRSTAKIDEMPPESDSGIEMMNNAIQSVTRGNRLQSIRSRKRTYKRQKI
jgi:predicted phosphatase